MPVKTRKTVRPFKMSKRNLRETLEGYFFIGPMLLGVGLFTFIPILSLFFLGFTEWNFMKGLQGAKFTGLENVRHMFNDDIFLRSILNNLIFLLVVPLTMIVALTLAIVIHRHVFMKDVFKVIYFLPYISSSVAVAIVFQVLFHPSMGPVNQFLMAIGIEQPPKWLADPQFALPSIMFLHIWMSTGFYLIVYMAGLQSIPKDLYEAADIDGANAWLKFRQITVPMLSPTSFFLFVTGIIYSFKAFDIIQVLTGGGPANATTVMVYHIYQKAFLDLEIGYASLLALCLFFIVLAMTALQFYGQKKWVNY